MSNNRNIRKMFEKEFDVEIMKQKILNEERKRNMNLKNLFKWAVAPICLVAIISGILIFNNSKVLKPNIYEPNIETKDNVSIYINDLSNTTQEELCIDADVKIINNLSIPYFEEIGSIVVPNDFDNNHDAYAIYVKSDRDSNEYNTLQCYVFNYSNTKNDRHIRVSFSKENKPIRDYYYSEEGSKISTINDTQLKIFKYNETYFTEFNYKGINFDIETKSVTEQELADLLLSIIK